jgi:hypothetical protein
MRAAVCVIAGAIIIATGLDLIWTTVGCHHQVEKMVNLLARCESRITRQQARRR